MQIIKCSLHTEVKVVMRQTVNASHFSLNTSRLLDSLIPDTLAQDFEATNGNIPLADVMEIGIAVVAKIFAL